MNPMMVAQNRTARLVREATTPTYTTSTPAPVVREREHLHVVEMEADTGYRTWSGSMPESKVNAYIDSFPGDYMLSDVDHAANCWCF